MTEKIKDYLDMIPYKSYPIAEIDGFSVTDEQLLEHNYDTKTYYKGSLINKLKSIYKDKIKTLENKIEELELDNKYLEKIKIKK